MIRKLISGAVGAMLLAVLALSILHAQQKPAEHQHEANSDSPTQDDKTGIFCPTMKTGQLCSHGTSDLLQLSGGNRDRWIAAVRRYNKAVDAATAQLQKDAQALLTPEQATEVQRWFAKGLNPEINKILVARAAQKAK